jgi:hypothetical protein
VWQSHDLDRRGESVRVFVEEEKQIEKEFWEKKGEKRRRKKGGVSAVMMPRVGLRGLGTFRTLTRPEHD